MGQILIIGASRGLGLELARVALEKGHQVVGISRRAPEPPLGAKFEFQSIDLAIPEGQSKLIELAIGRSYSKVLWVAGGGPYGLFGDLKWSAHEWAWQVSYLAVAKLVHALASARIFVPLVSVGSRIVEADIDPKAASYLAAKRALKGLIETLQAEYPQWDLRHFSPGYMDTEMLPKGSLPRERPVWKPAEVALQVWDWLETPDAERNLVLSAHDEGRMN